MFRKILYIFIFVSLILVKPAFASDFKILKTYIDSAEKSIMFRGNISASNIEYSVGLASNPTRAYIDLNNAVFTENKRLIELKNSPVNKISIAQFSTKPNKVRMVFYADSPENLKNIKLVKIGKNLTFRLDKATYKNSVCPVVYSDVLPKEYKKSVEKSANNQSKNTNFVVTNVTKSQKELILSGAGNIKLNRPFILTEPIRVVFDLPNTASISKDFYSEYKLNDEDSIKIGQFTDNVMRVVITTQNAGDYKAFLSPDLQSVMFANVNKLDKTYLLNSKVPSFVRKTELTHKDGETSIKIRFSSPIVHSLRRTHNKFLIDLLNVNYEQNKHLFKFEKTPQLESFSVQKMSENLAATTLTFPVNNTLKVTSALSNDGTTLVITINGEVEKKEVTQPASIKTLQNQPVIKAYLPLKDKLIVVDAGHGGKDAGAIGGNLLEKHAALKISQYLQKELENKGAKVIMTRKDDTFISLQDRVSISNFENADMFISVHLNACEKGHVNGIETHWYKPNSKKLAQDVHGCMIKDLPCNDRGLFNSMFYVINHTTAPAILVEVGFISNAQERKLLFDDKRQRATAKAIADGVVKYYAGGKKK